jgi:hypothetical protein
MMPNDPVADQTPDCETEEVQLGRTGMSLTPHQSFPDHFGFIGVREMPQEPLSCFFVNKGCIRRLIRRLPKMQID